MKILHTVPWNQKPARASTFSIPIREGYERVFATLQAKEALRKHHKEGDLVYFDRPIAA